MTCPSCRRTVLAVGILDGSRGGRAPSVVLARRSRGRPCSRPRGRPCRRRPWRAPRPGMTMTPASGASSASWGSSAWLVSCAGTKRDRLPWPIDPIVDRRAHAPMPPDLVVDVRRVRDQQSASHRTGVKSASRPPGITDVLTRALYRYAVRVRAEPRCSEQGRGNGLHAVGNIAALIPRAARVCLLKALVWASRVKAATLDQRSCDPGHGRTIPMCGAKGVLSSGSCLRRSAVGRSLVGVRRIFSMLGGLVGLLGLSVASQKIAQAARTLHPPPSIYLVGPTAAGKTTLFRYLCHLPRPDESASTACGAGPADSPLTFRRAAALVSLAHHR